MSGADLANRFFTPSDGMIHFAPKGEFNWVNPTDSKDVLVQVIDDTALAALKASFPADLFIDQDHMSGGIRNATTALGWVAGPESTEIRTDGLYAKPSWSDAGIQQVHGGNLRFVSPVFDRDSLVPMGRSAGNGLPRFRVMRIVEAGLTNKPNLHGIKPISRIPVDDETLLDNAGIRTVENRKAWMIALKNSRGPVSQALVEMVEQRQKSGIGEFPHLSGIERAKAAFAADLARSRKRRTSRQ